MGMRGMGMEESGEVKRYEGWRRRDGLPEVSGGDGPLRCCVGC